MVNGDDLTLREIESTIKTFIKTKIPPKNLLQTKLSGFREDRIENALIPSKHFPSHTPTVLRCRANDNCMYNSASILLMGDESLCNYLRVCVSIELYLEGNYYVEHPYTVSKQLSIPKHANYVFSMSLIGADKKESCSTDTNNFKCHIFRTSRFSF